MLQLNGPDGVNELVVGAKMKEWRLKFGTMNQKHSGCILSRSHVDIPEAEGLI